MSRNDHDGEFDDLVRRTLRDVDRATDPAPDLAERLVANVTSGRRAVVSIGSARRSARRWTLPLLAAAAVIAVVAGGSAIIYATQASHHRPATTPTPLPTPSPTTLTTSGPPPTKRATTHTTHSTHHAPANPALAPVPSGFRAADVSFTGQDGWALGDGACASGGGTDCAALIATTDGGTHWHRLSVPDGLVSTFDRASCGEDGTTHGLCADHVVFADALRGYLYGLKELWWTADGGRSWQAEPQASPGSWEGATALVISGSTALRILPDHQCSGGCTGRVQAAQIGSGAFVDATPGSTPNSDQSQLLSVGSSVYFRSVVGGTPDHPGLSETLYRSDDGGASWHPERRSMCSQVLPGRFADGFSAGFDSSIAVVCSTGTQHAEINVAPSATAAFGSGHDLSAVSATSDVIDLTAQRLVAVVHGNPYEDVVIFVSDDGGATWSRTAAIAGTTSGPTFTDASNGAIVGANGATLYRTTDGGHTWSASSF